MDLEYWGFQRWPFERSFAADRFYSGPTHDEALARLLFLIEEFRRTGIVTGPAGTGKTYLLKLLQQRADRLGRMTVRCEATGLTGHELAGQIANGCYVACDSDASSARIWSGLQAKFAALTLIQQPLVIIVDHFDLVEFSCQQCICRIRHLADSVGLKLTLIIATRDRIVPAALQEIVDLRIDIAPWTMAETSQFILTSIIEAGVLESTFTDEALNSIHDFTNGIPASVIVLCNLTLLAAMERNEKFITSDLVEDASKEMPSRSDDRSLKTRLTAV